MQSLEDRSSHSSNSAEALSAFEMINQLVSKIYASSFDLSYAGGNAFRLADYASYYYSEITFSQSC
jgi:hypothetical protein